MTALAQTRISPPQTSTMQVYDWLHGRILRGELPPASQMSESDIATSLGISRQPVREAFIRLTAIGLAEVRPQRGTYIARISIGAVLAARLVREAVESDLMRMLAVAMTDQIAADLHDQIVQQRDALARQDIVGFIALDDMFHKSLAAAAGHPEAWAVLNGLKSQMNRLRYITIQTSDQNALIDQHIAIVEALETGDALQAEQAMRQHLRRLLQDLPQVTAAYPDLFAD